MTRAGGLDDLPAQSSVAVSGRRLPKGERDRFGTARHGCVKCAALAPCSRGGGVVILFYAYVRVSDPNALAARLRSACDAAGVTGKIRVAAEGINGTAAGPTEGVDELIRALENDTCEPEMASASRTMDWKRQRGCAHLFDGVSVRVVPEIVPFDDRTRAFETPRDFASAPVERLDPDAFHAEAERVAASAASAPKTSADGAGVDGDTVLLDVRNWYESRIGYFVGAIRAPIRRFSQLKEWLDAEPRRFAGKRVLAYCTGGVRCEKACAFLASLDAERRPRSVAQLRGGIAAYARDIVGGEHAMPTRVRSGLDAPETRAEPRPNSRVAARDGRCLFLGSNFVFDARGATRVTDDVCGWCDGCGRRTDRTDACASVGCHTLLLVCPACASSSRDLGDSEARSESEGTRAEEGDAEDAPPGPPRGVFCCASCEAQDAERLHDARVGARKKKRRRPCDCDGYAARERRLSREKPKG